MIPNSSLLSSVSRSVLPAFNTIQHAAYSTVKKQPIVPSTSKKLVASFVGGVMCGLLPAHKYYLQQTREQRIEAKAALAERPNIQVIGGGFSRTGTVSLKVALDKLGINAYHSLDMFKDPDSAFCWEKYFKTGEDKYLYAALQGYEGAVDFPSFAMVEDLLKHFPEAKVILTTRENDGWAESAKKALYNKDDRTFVKDVIVFLGSCCSDKFQVVYVLKNLYSDMVTKDILDNETDDVNIMKAKMIDHNNRIRTLVSQKQLIEMPLGSGWRDLCAFLGKPEIQEPYPRTNDKDSIRTTVGRILEGKNIDITGASYKK